MGENKVIDQNEVYENTSFNRLFCIKQMNNCKSKCIEFYKKELETIDNVKKVICPFGYTVFIFANKISTSLIGNETDIVKIKRRDKYNNKFNNNFDFRIEDYDIYSEYFFNNIKEYTILYNDYNKVSPLLHDISNSISLFLDLKGQLEDSYNILVFIDGYKEINKKLINLKEYKLEYLSEYRNEVEYEKVKKLLKKSVDDFENFIKVYSRKANRMHWGKNDRELVIKSGYGLYDTIIDYYKKKNSDTKYKYDLSPKIHKPHKMLKKLRGFLAHQAKKKMIEIKFTSRSYESKNTIYNISDIYIAFFSILENSIKYSNFNEDIEIDINDIEDTVEISIKNQSGFISRENLNNISQKGFRAENAVQTTGSGYGLHLVDEIFKNARCDSPEYEFKDGYFIAKICLVNIV